MIFNLIILLLNYLHINPSCFEMMSFMDGFLPNLPIGIFGLKCFFFKFCSTDKPSTWPKTEICFYDIQPDYPAFKLHINNVVYGRPPT